MLKANYFSGRYCCSYSTLCLQCFPLISLSVHLRLLAKQLKLLGKQYTNGWSLLFIFVVFVATNSRMEFKLCPIKATKTTATTTTPSSLALIANVATLPCHKLFRRCANICSQIRNKRQQYKKKKKKRKKIKEGETKYNKV